ncbi:hypothetical protein [Frondihabitans cladoniiphilus]|uniref:Uncharacterized protein n=1 Tax=Frondihabitans cladoniiphilus TaxID=715785 RepID=A0ABP8VYU1_9MICO
MPFEDLPRLRTRLRPVELSALIVGVVLLAAGAAARVWAALHPAPLDWYIDFADSGSSFAPTRAASFGLLGGFFLVAGLVLLAFWLGLLIGRRRAAARAR